MFSPVFTGDPHVLAFLESLDKNGPANCRTKHLVFELLPVDAFAAFNLYEVRLYTPRAAKIFNSALACLEAVEIVHNDVTHRGYPIIKTVQRIHS